MKLKINWFKKALDNIEKLLAGINIIALVGVFLFLLWNYQSGGFLYILSQGDTDFLVSYFSNYSFLQKSALIISLVLIEVVVGIIPAVAMYPIVGLLVGIEWGFILISMGNVVGNVLNYWQGKLIAGAFVENTKYTKLIDKIQGGGLKELILIRINPLTSFDSVSYIAGALGMQFSKFLIATVVGVTPLILVGVSVGGEVLEKYDWALASLMIGVAVFVTLGLMRKIQRNFKLRKRITQKISGSTQ